MTGSEIVTAEISKKKDSISSIHIDINQNERTQLAPKPSSSKGVSKSKSRSIVSAVLFLLCSTSETFLNKALLSSYQFNHLFFIMTCETILSVAVFEICRCFQTVKVKEYYSLSQSLSLFLMAFFFGAYSLTSLHALGGMSIPMFAALKRCTPVVTLILSTFLLKTQAPNKEVVFAVILVTIGCIIAGAGDLQFSAIPYIFGTVSVVVRALYLIFIEKVSTDTSPLEILYVNSWTTMPVFFILFLIFDLEGVVHFKEVGDTGFLMCFLAQVFLGAFMSFTLFICTAENSALTTSVIGVIKTILVTGIGCFTFGGIHFNALIISGLILNTSGGVVYAIAKLRSRKKDEMEESLITKL